MKVQRIEKIKVRRHDFDTMSGPSTVTTLGIRIDGRDYTFGTFYVGPHMEKGADVEMHKVEQDIDYLVCLQRKRDA